MSGTFVEVLAYSEKCGHTPKLYGKLPSFPMHFSRSDSEHGFLGLFDLLFRPFPALFREIKKERGSYKKEGNPDPRETLLPVGRTPPLCGSSGRKGVSLRGRSLLLKLRFPFPRLLPADAVRVQLLRPVAELACSCLALVAILFTPVCFSHMESSRVLA